MKSPLRPGDPRSLGGYELLARLGEGGMGAVFLGRRDDGLRVAVKVIKPEYAHEEEFRGRFRSEVRRASEVPPFCTAAVLDADPEHRTPYLVVEFVDGPSLDEVIQRDGPMSAGQLHSLAVGVATALTAIHGAGVIHRDLKPRNVLLAMGAPKVIDFGIARALEVTSQHTRPDEMVGTVAYMAPERFDGIDREITPAADVFAWGAVIAYAGTGRTPFRADSPGATAARILTQPPDLTGLSEPLAGLVALTLAKDPQERPTAHELLNLLLEQHTGSRSHTRGDTLDPQLRQAAEAAQQSGRYVSGGHHRGAEVPRKPRRRARTIIAVTAVAAALMAVAGLYSRGLPQPEPLPPSQAEQLVLPVQPAMPVPGAVRGPWVVDALNRPGQWKSFTDVNDGRCSFGTSGLVMTTPEVGIECPGTTETFAGDQAIHLDVTVTRAKSCATVAFRAAGDAAYWLDLCSSRVRLRHQGAVQTTTLGEKATDLFAVGKVHAVALTVLGSRANVAIDGSALLNVELTDPSLLAGKVTFGVTPEKDGLDPAAAVVARAEIRPISSTAAPSATATTKVTFFDVRHDYGTSTVKVHAFSPKSKSLVVEPVLFLSGEQYCKTFAVKPSSDAPCDREWVTEDSRMTVTLPTSAAPKLTGTFDDPERCGGDPVTVGTCKIGADQLAERLKGGGLAQITTAGGVVTGVAEVYTP
ncbi:serine/threonine protein kinase [Actinoplanes cyaneus]|nr:serine/threonine-protein kinase [Actinoplanes cyaneus]MCW2139730.1 Serine/threonine protein kinase [Actinoplanes cyaneus]